MNNELNSAPETKALRLELFHMRALHDVVREIGTERDQRAIVTVAAMSVAGTMGTRTAVALLRDSVSDRVIRAYQMGPNEDAMATLEDADLAAAAGATEQAVVVLDGIWPEAEMCGLHVWIPIVVDGDACAGVGIGEKMNGQPYSEGDLKLMETIRIAVEQALHNAFLYSALEKANTELALENQDLEDRVEAGTAALSRMNQEGPLRKFVGDSLALRKVQQELAEAAPSDMTVLITGETGTGKGVAAVAVHDMSRRSEGAFIQVNCGAITEGLVDSELFGHEKGAFTGAVARKLGRIDLAKEGTLFLDEIGDMPPETQVKLLRLLEEGTYERVGGTETLMADVRIVAATNRDLEQMVADGSFRQDLYFRLRGYPVPLPPLRERREDIVQLAEYFIGPMAAHIGRKGVRLGVEAQALLKGYQWPGNVRELKHTVERAVVTCRGQVIGASDIPLITDANNTSSDGHLTLEEMERRYIRQVLVHTGWVVRGEAGAAAILGLPESTLRNRMRKLGIEREYGGKGPAAYWRKGREGE